MKKQFLMLFFLGSIFGLFNYLLVAYAFEPKYSVHTSSKDIELKKKKALRWYEDNVNNKKFYGYDANKHVNSLKAKALKWYENKILNKQFYFVHTDKELEFTKQKALRWHEKNSQ